MSTHSAMIHVVGTPDLVVRVAAVAREAGWNTSVYQSGLDLLESLHPAQSNCVVVFHSLSDMSGMELLNQLKRRCRPVYAILVSDTWYLADVVAAMKAGAFEVLETNADPERYRRAISEVLRVEELDREKSRRRIPASILEKLNAEEAKIFQLLSDGYTAKQIGAELDMSVRTIHYRKKELLQKLGARDRAEAMDLCTADRGLTSLPGGAACTSP